MSDYSKINNNMILCNKGDNNFLYIPTYLTKDCFIVDTYDIRDEHYKIQPFKYDYDINHYIINNQNYRLLNYDSHISESNNCIVAYNINFLFIFYPYFKIVTPDIYINKNNIDDYTSTSIINNDNYNISIDILNTDLSKILGYINTNINSKYYVSEKNTLFVDNNIEKDITIKYNIINNTDTNFNNSTHNTYIIEKIKEDGIQLIIPDYLDIDNITINETYLLNKIYAYEGNNLKINNLNTKYITYVFKLHDMGVTNVSSLSSIYIHFKNLRYSKNETNK